MDPLEKRRGRGRLTAYPVYLGNAPLLTRKRQAEGPASERRKAYIQARRSPEPELVEVPVEEPPTPPLSPRDAPLRPSDVRPLLASFHNRFTSKNYWDTYTGVALNTAGALGLLADLAQGTSQQERVGKRVRLNSLHIRGLISLGTQASAAPLFATLLIVFDREPTGILPAPSAILANSPTPVALAYSHANDSNSTRFRVVMRRMYSMNFLRQSDPVVLEEFLDLKGLYTIYGSDTTGALSNIKQGALYYLVAALQDPAIPAENMTLYMSSRLRFMNAP